MSLGSWYGIRLRLHALFLFVGIATLFLSTRSGEADLVWYGAASLAVLFVSVLVHELAHRAAAARVGGHADVLVLGPLGGLVEVTVPPHEPQSELLAALAGPAANFLIWAATVPLLWGMGGTSLLGLLNPLKPEDLVEGSPFLVVLKLVFWINWLLVLVNLLPGYPFDGGRAVRALLWPMVGYRQAVVFSAWIARGTAAVLCLVAWLVTPVDDVTWLAPWVPLATLSLILLFSANEDVFRVERRDVGEEFPGYDFSADYSRLDQEPTRPGGSELGVVTRWLAKRREEKERQRREIETAEEHQVDEILARLHGAGMAGLTPDERALLQRVSVRYRNRQKSS